MIPKLKKIEKKKSKFGRGGSNSSKGKEARVLLLGLDASGKTTILYRMKLGEVVTTIPTIGFNVETVQLGRKEAVMWDVGGQPKIRPLWRHYYQSTQLVLYCVDSSDTQTMKEAGDELAKVLNDGEMAGVPAIIACNKQDLPTALTPPEVVEKMELPETCFGEHEIRAVACCAVTDVTLIEEALVSLLWGPTEFKRFTGRNDPSAKSEPRPVQEDNEAVQQEAERAARRATFLDGVQANLQFMVHSFSSEPLHESYSPTATAFGKVAVPQEVVSEVFKFLPAECLLPTLHWHLGLQPTVEEGIAWCVNRNFLYAAFSTVCVRLIDESEDREVVLARLRAFCALQPPAEFVALQLATVAAVMSSWERGGLGFCDVLRCRPSVFLPNRPLGCAFTVALGVQKGVEGIASCGVNIEYMLEAVLGRKGGGPDKELLMLLGLDIIKTICSAEAKAALWVAKNLQDLNGFADESDAEDEEMAGVQTKPKSVEINSLPFSTKEADEAVSELLSLGSFGTLEFEEKQSFTFSHNVMSSLLKLLMKPSLLREAKITLHAADLYQSVLCDCAAQAAPNILRLEMIGVSATPDQQEALKQRWSNVSASSNRITVSTEVE